MFRNAIAENALFNSTANDCFRNIRGDMYSGDTTFVSTLRALVMPRMKEDEQLIFKMSSSMYSASDIGNNPAKRMVSGIYDHFEPEANNTIYLHNFHHNQESNYANLELVKSTWESVYPGWQMLTKVTDFFRKQFYVVCFVHPERKSVILFTERLDMRKYHYLQCSIFAFLPWYFNPEDGVSEQEMELINALREKSSDKYIEVIAKIAEQYNLREKRIRNLLSGFESRADRGRYENIKSEIESIDRDIRAYNERITDRLRQKSEREITMLGLRNKIAQTEDSGRDSEIMEYFLCNNKLDLVRSDDTELIFTVKTEISYFDEEMAESAIDNKSSYLYLDDYDRRYEDVNQDDLEKLFRAIFVDQKFKINVCAAYRFDIRGGVDAISEYSFDASTYSDCMPNPHIDGYRCMGNYNQTINELLINHDYIGAIEQCIASCKSLNFADSTVMGLFSSIIQGQNHRNNRCIVLPDGNVVKPIDAIKWMKEQEDTKSE